MIELSDQEKIKKLILNQSELSKRYFNPNGDEPLNQKIIGSEPTGFTNFNEPRYDWSIKLYEGMENNSWFLSEVDTSNALKEYNAFSNPEKTRYTRGFAQLSFNDSIQEDFLLDIRKHTTNKLVKSLLNFQAYQEGLHSKGYSQLLAESGNYEEVFNLYKTDYALLEKNMAIAEQFSRHIDGTTSDKLLLSAMGSVAMEGIYFQLGFANIYLFGVEKAGAAISMIKFIARDELTTHLPIFANIFKSIKRENNIDIKTIDKCYKIIEEAANIEIRYGLSLLRDAPTLGLTDTILQDTVKNFANQRLVACGLNKIYNVKPKTYLEKLIDEHKMINDTRTGLFEGNVAAYSKNAVDMNDF